MTQTRPALLSIRSLSKRFGDTIAVDDVSIDIHQNEFFALLGPSGCGKTTTLQCIAGLENPGGGRILMGGAPVFDAASGQAVPAHRRDLGMVFQSYAIWPHMNVFDNVAFPLRVGRRRLSGKEIETIITDDDVAVENSLYTTGRRGVAGTLVVTSRGEVPIESVTTASVPMGFLEYM